MNEIILNFKTSHFFSENHLGFIIGVPCSQTSGVTLVILLKAHMVPFWISVVLCLEYSWDFEDSRAPWKCHMWASRTLPSSLTPSTWAFQKPRHQSPFNLNLNAMHLQIASNKKLKEGPSLFIQIPLLPYHDKEKWLLWLLMFESVELMTPGCLKARTPVWEHGAWNTTTDSNGGLRASKGKV